MTRRLEELELKKMHEVQAVAETPVQVKPCPICQSYEHLVEECPTIPAAREMFGDQANVIGQFKPNNNASYGNTYNSSWRNHPNFSWKPRAPQLTNLNTVQEKGRFPSQPHQNPKGIHEVETHEGESSQVRDVKALITLRSGKKVELPTPKPHVEEKKKKRQRRGRKSKERRKISDLCTIKRGLNVNKKAFLTEQVSAIIQCKSPLKYKDPGCPTISVMIGGKVVEKALLDLGASVNLLPYSVYKQLGLGELKPTSITLSLADRSVKIPRGIIEDVLVQAILATQMQSSNRNGLMQLTFGNMTLELNIFYMSKKLITPKKKKVQKRLEEEKKRFYLFNKEEAQEAAKEETQSSI
ncbi:hypothetical protein CK203_087663 [Vitis vinifera]|uniref:Uncharacterized protein n=1 Tax=Vitis vinifera TaxID=29760 RepID=A0A438C774_VITVI|nr:hypothetical protein CK203_087663 [Vitis vinifera]